MLSADPSLALKVNLSVPLKPSLGVYVKAPVSALKPVISPDLGSETMHSVTVVSFLKVSVFPVNALNPFPVEYYCTVIVYGFQECVLGPSQSLGISDKSTMNFDMPRILDTSSNDLSNIQ